MLLANNDGWSSPGPTPKHQLIDGQSQFSSRRLPGDLYFVAGDITIGREDWHILQLALDHQQPIEWVGMNLGERVDLKGVAWCHRERREALYAKR